MTPGIDALILGNPQITAESLIAYEIGYRAQPEDFFSWDAAAYYNDYDDLIGLTNQDPFFSNGTLFFPSEFANNLRARGLGFELTSTVEMTDAWRVTGAYTFTQVDAWARTKPWRSRCRLPPLAIRFTSALRGTSRGTSTSISPAATSIRSATLRRIPITSAYVTMDLRLGWRPWKNTEFAVVGQNLLDRHHYEFDNLAQAGSVATEVPRGVYGSVTWRR